VELLIVLALLAVLLFLAVPTFQNLLQSTLQQEVNRLSGVLRLMRNEAVLTRTRYRLALHLKEGRYEVERQDEYGAYEVAADPRVLRPHAFPERLRVRALLLLGRVYRPDEPEPVAIVVDASGYVDPFLLHLTHGDDDYTLRVSGFTGRVELLEGHAEPESQTLEEHRR
jgi:type II secretory pathway pseudopilin PulG